MHTHTPSRRRAARVAAAVGVAVAGVVGAASLAAASDRDDRDGRRNETLRFDVAENGKRFAFDEEPVFPEDGLPQYGNGFVTEGYVFEAGTLGESNGVDADGNVLPAFEDDVIGEWKCFGYMIGDGARTVEDEWVVSTQIYRFYGDNGRDAKDRRIVSVGTENVAHDEAVIRAITGGTGRFSDARGEATQLTLGHNASEGVNAQFQLSVAHD